MTIRTKSVFQGVDKEDGYRVLISRFYPRGVRRENFDEWVSSLSPKPELLFKYKHGAIDWDSFKRSFMLQLKNDIDGLEAVFALHDLSKMHDITLLCFEKSGVPCHRHLVRDVVENPSLLALDFESENTDDHKGVTIQSHISNQEAPLIISIH